ncbi:hypothetical protein LguiA_025069 [Lonicera macranthoides]
MSEYSIVRSSPSKFPKPQQQERVSALTLAVKSLPLLVSLIALLLSLSQSPASL